MTICFHLSYILFVKVEIKPQAIDFKFLYIQLKSSSGFIHPIFKPNPSHRSTHQHFFDLADGFGWVELFRADVDAVHNRVAAEQTIWVVEVVETRGGVVVAGVGDESVRGEQACGSDEFIWVPPERWA